MLLRRLRSLTVPAVSGGALAAVVLLPGLSVPDVPPPPPVPLTLGAVAFGGEVDELTRVGDYAYLELNSWEAGRAAELKRRNPRLKVLVYQDMASTRSYAVTGGRDDADLPTGVGYRAARPEWFLTDTTGARVQWPYAGHWWMDVGSPAYQQAWADRVEALLAAGPWDGVIVDNVMASPASYLGPDRVLAKYPSVPAYAAATESFLRAVAPRLRATGKIVLGNVSDASPQTWDRWVGLLSGANHERSFTWDDGTLHGGARWLERVQEIERTAALGRISTATSVVGPDDVRAQTYVRASWLLAWDGGASGAAQLVAVRGRRDPWNAVVATDLGLPLGPRRAVGGAWLRDLTRGTAVVNPSDRPVTVALTAPAIDASGRLVTEVRLAPLTAALLRR